MNFSDTTLVRLATPFTRAALFDQTALEQIVATAYDADALSLEGPYSPIFDQIILAISVSQVGMAEGTIRSPSGTTPTAFQLQVAGLGPLLPARVDALWRGSVIARGASPTGEIIAARTRFLVDDIDAEIVKDSGALPVDVDQLETERRKRFIAKLQGALAEPGLLTDMAFDRWLASVGADSVNDLIANHRGTLVPGTLGIRYAAPADTPATPRQLPIAAAVLIRDTGFSLGELLTHSKLVREQLQERGIDVPYDRTLPARNPFLVVWLVPTAVFDDSAWPGAGADPAALRASRRQNASQWLAAEGIAIAAIDT